MLVCLIKTRGICSLIITVSRGVKLVHSIGSKKNPDDENDLNMGNKVIDQIVTEKESPQTYGSAILEKLAFAVAKFCQTEARNGKKI